MDDSSENDDVFVATRWQKPGDHPRVRQASKSEVPWATNPETYGWLDDHGGVGQVVLPGDFIVSDSAGRLSVVNERIFRRQYAPRRVQP